MIKRTIHGKRQHKEPDRPTSEAVRDKQEATEIYLDLESGYYVFVGQRGRTHIFMETGEHHTSFRTTQANRQARCKSGQWERIERYALPKELN